MSDLDLWTPQTTGEKLYKTEGTLANWRSRGEGPPYVKLGGRIFYEPAAVRRWVESHRRSSTTEAA